MKLVRPSTHNFTALKELAAFARSPANLTIDVVLVEGVPDRTQHVVRTKFAGVGDREQTVVGFEEQPELAYPESGADYAESHDI